MSGTARSRSATLDGGLGQTPDHETQRIRVKANGSRAEDWGAGSGLSLFWWESMIFCFLERRTDRSTAANSVPSRASA